MEQIADWLLLIILAQAILVELLYLLFETELPARTFVPQYMVKPGLEMGAVILASEALIRYVPVKLHDYGIIPASALLALILTANHSAVLYSLILFIFPIGISIFYFQYKKLAFAIAMTLISLNGLYVFNAITQENLGKNRTVPAESLQTSPHFKEKPAG